MRQSDGELIGSFMRGEPKSGLDTSIFFEVIENGDAMARTKLATQLAALLSSEGTSKADCAQVVPVVLKLSVDPVKEVRRILVDGLVPIANLHADVLFSIIADDDDVALPFLAVTPALNHWHMLAVLRVGDVARQQTIVLRPDLSKEALAYAVKSAPLEVCLRLFDNTAMHFDDGVYHTLYTRFGQVPEMAERGWMADNDANELVADAEETAILRILVEASNDELARVIPFLVAKKMLTPSMIVRAAAIGEMKMVQWSLAHLSGVGLKRAQELMFGRGLMGLKSLHSKSGLPQSCYGLLMAACDVVKDAKEEGLELDPESFGRRLIEALMTRYENMQSAERSKNLEFIGRYAEDRVRKIAKRLRADMVRAA